MRDIFIAFIPKENGSCQMLDFWPISLVGSLYKIIAKVFSCRLCLVMNDAISSTQSAFIKGRLITDGILVANECVDYWHRTRRKGLIGKIDLEKAFTQCTVIF